jgi:hypothetical protein
MTVGEVLVVDYGPAEDDAAPSWPVIAQAPPRVMVLRADTDQLDEIGRQARLAMARSPEGEVRVVGDEDALSELDEGAGLFVAGWRARAIDKPDRPGEGLPWDQPGFEPPDRPSE